MLKNPKCNVLPACAQENMGRSGSERGDLDFDMDAKPDGADCGYEPAAEAGSRFVMVNYPGSHPADGQQFRGGGSDTWESIAASPGVRWHCCCVVHRLLCSALPATLGRHRLFLPA